MVDHDAAAYVALGNADASLDAAWHACVGLDAALTASRRARVDVGGDPWIEDAKLLVAEHFCCSPTAAYDLLVWNSAHTGLGQFAHDVLTGSAAVSLPDN
jgi:hypothetical protein